MFYIIQESVFRDRNYDLIFETLNRLGLEYEIAEALPFTEELTIKTKRKDVFVFGSVKLARLAQQYDWTPGTFFGGNHDYMIYSQYYKENMLNYDSQVVPFNTIISWYPNETKFIRPTEDSKLFTGALFSKIKWEDLQRRTIEHNDYNKSENLRQLFDENTMIQVAEPKRIYREARTWIVGGKVVTSSYYRFAGQYMADVEDEGIDFANAMAKIYQVADSFVMDIALTSEGWKIVECNCINCSGFYKGDLQKLLIALEERYGI